MAYIAFFASPEEGLDLAQFFLNQGCWLTPNRNYPGPKYHLARTIEEVKAAQVDREWPTNSFHVGRWDYCLIPLEMNQIKDGPTTRPENARKWYIVSRCGGATIDLTLGINVEVMRRRRLLGTGSISHYPDYWQGKLNYKPPESMRTLYKDALAFIRKRARHWKIPEGNSYWVWDGVIEMLKQGYRLSLTGYEDPDKVLSLLPQKKQRRTVPS